MDLNAKFPPVISAFMRDDSRHRFILGPFGSGKSFANIIEVVRRATMQHHSPDGRRKSRIAVVRNTMPQLRDTTMKSWFDVIPNGAIGTYNSTGKTYHIKTGDVDCEVIFRALDDASDVKNLLSLELTAVWINEFRDIAREITEALDGRVGRYPRMADGGPSWTGIFGDSNMPEEGSYWERMCEGYDPDDPKTKKANGWKIFKQPPGMLKQVDGTYIDNPDAENKIHLPPNYYLNLVTGKTDEYIRTYVMCEYGRSKGGKPVHPAFSREMHVAKAPLKPDPNNMLLISFDFGLTPSAVFSQQDAHGRVHVFDCITTEGMGVERAIDDKILPLVRRKYSDFDVECTGDPSGSASSQSDETSCLDVIRRYRRKGLGRVKLAYSNSPVHRQGALDYFLCRIGDQGRPMFQVDPECDMIIRGLSGGYRYKQFKDGRPSTDVEKNEYSHPCEALEYGMMHWERGGRRKAEHPERAFVPRAAVNHYNTPR